MSERVARPSAKDEPTLKMEKFISTDTEEEEDAESVVPTQLTRLPDVAAESRRLTRVIQRELDAAEDDTARARLLHSLALVIEHRQGDSRRALFHLLEAHRLRPDNLAYLRSLRRALWSRGNWPMVTRLLDAEFNLLKDPARRAMLLVLKGEIARDRLADTAAALEAYLEALRLIPGDPLVLSQARLLLGLTGEGERQAEVCRQHAAVTGDARLRSVLLTEAGRLSEEHIDDEEAALQDHAAALAADPDNAAAQRAHARLLERLGGQEQLVAALEQEGLGADAGPTRTAALTRAAHICHDELGQPGRALELLARAHARDGGLPRALDALLRAPVKGDKREALLASMEDHAGGLQQRQQKADVLCFIGQKRRGDGRAHLLRQALELIPDHRDALEIALADLTNQEAWDEALEIADRALEHTEDQRLRLELLRSMGAICEAGLQDPRRAVALYSRALELAPEDLATLHALRALCWRTGQHERLPGALEQLIACAADDREAVALLHEKARVVELHLRTQDTASIHERILELAPRDQAALEALDRIYGARGDDAGICRVLSVLSSQEEDPQHRETLLLRLAGAREAVGDTASATWALGMAVPQTEDLVLARELRRLRQQQAQWDMVVESLEQEARLSLARGGAARSLMLAATILEDRLDDAPRAEGVLRRVLEQDPLHEEAGERLNLMLGKGKRWDRLADVLEMRIASLEQPTGGGEPRRRLELLFRLAELQQLHLDRPREAVDSARRCLEIDPAHRPSLRFLGPLYVEQEEWEEAAEIYSRLLATCHDTDELRSIQGRLGELYSERLDKPLRAISCYQSMLAVTPGDTEALTRLWELFARVDDRNSAADTLARLIEVTDNPVARAGLNITLADFYEQVFDEPVLAAEHLQQAQHVDPTNEELLARLIRLLTRLDRWEELGAALRSFLAVLPEEQQARGNRHRMELGRIMQHRLGRPAEGLEQYQAVIDLDPTNLRARHAAARVLLEDNRLDEAARAYGEILDIDACDTSSLRQLRGIWSRQDELDGAFAATAVLSYLGEATGGEARHYEEQRGKGTRYPRRCLEPSAFETVLVHPSENANGRGVLAVLVRVAHHLFPPPLQSWGVGPQSLLSPQSEHPLPGLVAQVARVLGLEFRVDVHLSTERPAEVGLLMTDPPTLVVGEDVMESRSPLEVRCEVGRLLAYLRNQSWIAHGMDHKELGTLVVCACIAAGASMKPARGRGREARVQLARRIQRSLAPDDMADLEAACGALRKGHEPDFEVWDQSMHHTALRTALWVTNDLETVLDHVLTRDGAPAKDRRAAVGGSPLAQDLIRYWMSDEFIALRKTIG